MLLSRSQSSFNFNFQNSPWIPHKINLFVQKNYLLKCKLPHNNAIIPIATRLLIGESCDCRISALLYCTIQSQYRSRLLHELICCEISRLWHKAIFDALRESYDPTFSRTSPRSCGLLLANGFGFVWSFFKYATKCLAFFVLTYGIFKSLWMFEFWIYQGTTVIVKCYFGTFTFFLSLKLRQHAKAKYQITFLV